MSSMQQMNAFLEQLNVQVVFSKLKLIDPNITEESEETETTAVEIQKKLNQFPSSEMKILLAEKLKLLETCII